MSPQDKSSEISRLPYFTATRPHLLLVLALGAITAAVVSAYGWFARLLLGQGIATWMYLILVTVMMLRVDPHRVRAVACHEDARMPVVLAIVCFDMVANMVVTAFELATAESAGHTRMSHYIFTGITVLGAWLVVPTMFTVYYTHLCYHTPREPPLRFPDEQPEPDYQDFLYFSLTTAVASQVANISIRSRIMRQVVLGQSLLPFFFNTSILALSISIAADLFP